MGDFKKELSRLQLGDFKPGEISTPGDKSGNTIINERCGRCGCFRCGESCFRCGESCFRCGERCFSCARCGF